MSCELSGNPCDECEEGKCPDVIAEDERKHEELKNNAFAARSEAERVFYEYFSNCELGEERERAYQIYENIRLATRL